MATITIEQKTNMSEDEAFQLLKDLLDNDADLRKLDKNYQCQFDDTSKTGSAKGSKFEAKLAVKGDAPGSNVSIQIKLPLMLTPFKAMIEGTLQKKVQKALT